MAWAFAPSEDEAAPEVVRLTRERTAARAGCRWISDGRRIYHRAIRRIYRDAEHTGKRGRPRLIPTVGVGLVQAVKRRQGGRLVRVEVRPRFGEVPQGPYTVCVERLNGVLRDRLGCLTRKTHALAKQVSSWDAAVRLCLFEHNWMHPLASCAKSSLILPPGAATGSGPRLWCSASATTFGPGLSCYPSPLRGDHPRFVIAQKSVPRTAATVQHNVGAR